MPNASMAVNAALTRIEIIFKPLKKVTKPKFSNTPKLKQIGQNYNGFTIALFS
jgi:hypothetical protein